MASLIPNTLVPVDLVSRVLITLAIIAAGLLVYYLLNQVMLKRAQKNNIAAGNAIPGARRGVPMILYFTTPECVPCKTVQRPALQQIQARMGEGLQVVEIDAREQADLASRWGVLSVPTTFVIDARGQVRHVNHGAARAEKLLLQLQN